MSSVKWKSSRRLSCKARYVSLKVMMGSPESEQRCANKEAIMLWLFKQYA